MLSGACVCMCLGSLPEKWRKPLETWDGAITQFDEEESILPWDDDVSKRQDRAVHDLLNATQLGITVGGGGCPSCRRKPLLFGIC